jgi:hypothetical protein
LKDSWVSIAVGRTAGENRIGNEVNNPVIGKSYTASCRSGKQGRLEERSFDRGSKEQVLKRTGTSLISLKQI